MQPLARADSCPRLIGNNVCKEEGKVPQDNPQDVDPARGNKSKWGVAWNCTKGTAKSVYWIGANVGWPVLKYGGKGTGWIAMNCTPLGKIVGKIDTSAKSIKKYAVYGLKLSAVAALGYGCYTAYHYSSGSMFPFNAPAQLVDKAASGAWSVTGEPVMNALPHVAQQVNRSIEEAITNAGQWGTQKVADFAAYLTAEGVASISMKVIGTAASVTWNIGTSMVMNSKKEVWAVLGCYSAVIFGMAYGAKIFDDVMEYCSLRARHAIGAPMVNIEYRPAMRLGWAGKKLAHFFRNKVVRPVYNKEIRQQLHVIKNRLETIRKNKGFLPNLILEGPPGTGKSMFANWLANESGMRYVKMSGADLAQYIKRGEHVSKWNETLQWAKKGKGPTILFIDEAEAMVGTRENFDQEHRELLNAFLAATGEPSDKIMVVMATNRLGDLDEAVISRSDLKLHIGPPDYASRKKILRQYIDQYMENEPKLRSMFTDRFVGQIAGATKNLSGRTLSKMVYALISECHASKNNLLTKREVFQVVGRFIDQERRMPRSLRSSRFVEIPLDAYYFTLPRIKHATWRAMVAIKEFFVSIPRFPGYMWREGLPNAGRAVLNAPKNLKHAAVKSVDYARFWEEEEVKPLPTGWEKFKDRLGLSPAAQDA